MVEWICTSVEWVLGPSIFISSEWMVLSTVNEKMGLGGLHLYRILVYNTIQYAMLVIQENVTEL